MSKLNKLKQVIHTDKINDIKTNKNNNKITLNSNENPNNEPCLLKCNNLNNPVSNYATLEPNDCKLPSPAELTMLQFSSEDIELLEKSSNVWFD